MLPLAAAALAKPIGDAVQGTIGSITGLIGQNQQLKANKKAQGAITNAYNQGVGYQQPFYNAGQQGLGKLTSQDYGVSTPGAMRDTYQAPQFNFEADPGYQFSKQQGMESIMGSAAGKGAALSGSTMKALQKYGTGLANQTYDAAHTRYNQDRAAGAQEHQYGQNFNALQNQQDYSNRNQQATQQYGRAQDLANYGQTAGQNLSTLASNQGANMANLYRQGGQIQASGTNSLGQLIGNTAGNMLGAGLSYFGQPGEQSQQAVLPKVSRPAIKSMLSYASPAPSSYGLA